LKYKIKNVSPPRLSSFQPSPSAIQVVGEICKIQSKYWSSLRPLFIDPVKEIKTKRTSLFFFFLKKKCSFFEKKNFLASQFPPNSVAEKLSG